ncbi:MAG: DNA repair protein RecO [Brevinematia bacterium]
MRNKKFRRITGIVLGTKDVSEGDKVVVVFSPELGKYNLMAYGANRFKSRFSNRTNTSNVIQGWVRFPQGLNKIPSLENAEVLVNFFDELKNNYLKLFSANIASEIINLVVPQEVFDQELYDTTIKFFSKLIESENEEDSFLTLSKFLILLLKIQGVLPYIKEEKEIEPTTKFFILSLLKDSKPGKDVDTSVKLDFLEWFERKLSKITNERKIISIQLLKRVIK